MSAGSTAPWWQTSLKNTTAVMVAAVIGVFAPWPVNGFALAAAVVFLLVALNNPELWLRPLAQVCVTGAAASAALPDIGGRFDLDLGS